jgi:hypothetical protein
MSGKRPLPAWVGDAALDIALAIGREHRIVDVQTIALFQIAATRGMTAALDRGRK